MRAFQRAGHEAELAWPQRWRRAHTRPCARRAGRCPPYTLQGLRRRASECTARCAERCCSAARAEVYAALRAGWRRSAEALARLRIGEWEVRVEGTRTKSAVLPWASATPNQGPHLPTSLFYLPLVYRLTRAVEGARRCGAGSFSSLMRSRAGRVGLPTEDSESCGNGLTCSEGKT